MLTVTWDERGFLLNDVETDRTTILDAVDREMDFVELRRTKSGMSPIFGVMACSQGVRETMRSEGLLLGIPIFNDADQGYVVHNLPTSRIGELYGMLVKMQISSNILFSSPRFAIFQNEKTIDISMSRFPPILKEACDENGFIWNMKRKRYERSAEYGLFGVDKIIDIMKYDLFPTYSETKIVYAWQCVDLFGKPPHLMHNGAYEKDPILKASFREHPYPFRLDEKRSLRWGFWFFEDKECE